MSSQRDSGPDDGDVHARSENTKSDLRQSFEPIFEDKVSAPSLTLVLRYYYGLVMHFEAKAPDVLSDLPFPVFQISQWHGDSK